MSRQPLVVPMLPGSPPELLVHDATSNCPYLAGRIARLPLRLPCRPLRRPELDERLAAGDRRQGFVLYRTACPECRACEPIRIDVEGFAPSRSLRRVTRRGDALLTVSLGRPTAEPQRVALYNRHKRRRGLLDGHPPMDLDGYRDFLVSTCCDTFEMRYRHAGRLVGVAIVDRGERSLSAVYCYYDPDQAALSIGTYSILKQLQLCRRLGARYLYLGLHVADCRAMTYKARFRPHERLLDGRWCRFDRPTR